VITINRTLFLGLTMLMLMFGGCAVSNESTDSDYLPTSQWATIDGDLGFVTGNEMIYGQHRVLTLNGHDLNDGKHPRVKEQKKVDCLLRECKLYPGQHSILVVYRWDSTENANRDRKILAWIELAGALLTIGGMVTGDMFLYDPEGPVFPCEAKVDFEVQARHDYVLRIVHTKVHAQPEDFQIVDKVSGAVVGSARPSCN
jgi:hypothetical protein